jgi:PleD family two-component response regulator
MFQGVRKVFKPDLVVICFVDYLKPDSRFMSFIEDKNRSVPVLTVGIEVVDAFYAKTQTGGGIVHLPRKAPAQIFLQQVCSLVGLSMHSINHTPSSLNESGKPRILVVDDFGMLLRQVRMMLKDRYDVEVATTGVQAMASIGRMKPDLILLDYAMPVHDGKKVFEVLKLSEETKDIPVVFLTGVSDNARVEEIINLRPAGYLLKPPNKERLVEMIENVLARKRSKIEKE